MKNIYFASDFHLGLPASNLPVNREKLVVEWLQHIKPTCKELYLLGDIFDFWFEYSWVAPKGHVRFLASLANFVDSGIPVYMFQGNHDQWLGKYLPEEIGVTVLIEPQLRIINGKQFYIHHGHALGKYDKGMNALHWVFTRKILQKMFRWIHPDLAFLLANGWSRKNRKEKIYESSHYMGDDKEFLLLHAKDVLQTQHIDYFVFGHRHVAIDKNITENSRYINLGNWITNTTYASFDGTDMQLQMFKPELHPDIGIER